MDGSKFASWNMVLLVVALACVAGVLLLDHVYLRPYVADRQNEAIHRHVFRAGQSLHEAIRREQDVLLGVCRSWARAGEPGAAGAHAEADPDERAKALDRADVDMAWTAGPGKPVQQVWFRPPGSAQNQRLTREDAAALTGHCPASFIAGLAMHGSGVYVLARCDVHDATPAGKPSLWLARRLTQDRIDRLAHAVSAEGMHLAYSHGLPRGMARGASGTYGFFLMPKQSSVAAAWILRGAGGERLAYLQGTLGVGHILRLANSIRRVVLIVLSLAIALVLVVLIAAHFLIAGPLARLLGRVQAFASGGGGVKPLSADLRGRPLALARSLESAFDKLAHISRTDELTGLANRRHFEEVFDLFFRQASRYERPLSLMVMDVDFFKAVNDAGGHHAGDELLQEVAQCICRACRAVDVPARLGGDEFAVLLPETSAAAALAVAERIRRSVALLTAGVKDTRVNVTLSIGVADMADPTITEPKDLLARADRALYRAKKLGRDRVLHADDLQESDRAALGALGDGTSIVTKLAGLDSEFRTLFLHAVHVIVEMIERRDPYMAENARKVGRCATLVAREMDLPERMIRHLESAAMLHDVGMLAMPDKLLRHPSELTKQQRQKVHEHPQLSVNVLEAMQFLEQEVPAVRHHHEWYDGSGYPDGLAGPAIPLLARILAVADAYVAMTSPRAFRDARSAEDALAELHRQEATQFDPAVVAALVAALDHHGTDAMRPSTPLPPRDDQTPGEPHDTLAPANAPAQWAGNDTTARATREQ